MNHDDRHTKNSDLKTRALSAAVLLIAIFSLMALSRFTRVLCLTVLAVLACREMATVLREYSLDIKKVKYADEPETPLFATKWPLVASSVIGMAVLIFLRLDTKWYIAWFALCVFCILFAEIVSKDWYVPERARNVMGNLFCLVYPAFPFFLTMYYCAKEYWVGPFLLAITATALCDTFALLAGRAFGKRKLASLVSPNKTWEGAICGALSSFLSALLVWALLRYIPFLTSWQLPLGPCMVTALISSTLGQVGDLTASLFKRMAGKKDYSNLIPGHGGVMDRSDSFLFSVPSAFFCLSLFGLLG